MSLISLPSPETQESVALSDIQQFTTFPASHTPSNPYIARFQDNMHFSRFILPFLAAVAIAQDGDDNDPSNDDDNDAVGAASTAVANGGLRASMLILRS